MSDKKELAILLDEVTVRHVTCPYCGVWLCNMSQIVCKHLKEWDEDYATFEEISPKSAGK